jgi:hypothetical protein
MGHIEGIPDSRGVYTNFSQGNLRKRYYLEDLGVCGRIILKWIFKKLCRGMERIYLTQARYSWQALVNLVINFRVP